MVANETHLQIGGILFSDLDQCDFTGPFEVLSRIPNSTFHILASTRDPVRDTKGLVLTPERSFADSPPLDLLLVPGGAGVNAAMENTALLEFVRAQAANAQFVLSVCTGALVLGAAGLLKDRKATTHWASHHLLHYLGAKPVKQRVVRDGKFVTCAGVTAGFDGALVVAGLLRGETAAQQIQLHLEYDPQPPFNCGDADKAPAELVRSGREALQPVLDARLEIVKRAAANLRVG